MDGEIIVLSSMTGVVKEVATAIRESKTLTSTMTCTSLSWSKGNKWYTVFVRKVPWIYSLWEDCSEQVAFVPNISHIGFKTRRAVEQANTNYVRKHTVGVVEVANIAVATAVLRLVHIVGVVEVAVGKAAPRLAVKNFIIVVQSITIALL
ncbi:translational activator gcn1 [Hordeum vulgare]|nr:translational activator gcn1 [Hordeum vulgare]